MPTVRSWRAPPSAMGWRTVRGSTTRGASRALLGMTREAEAGHAVAFTPDGPRGPARRFAPGALVVAQRTGRADRARRRARVARLAALRAGIASASRSRLRACSIAYGDPERVDADSPRAADGSGAALRAAHARQRRRGRWLSAADRARLGGDARRAGACARLLLRRPRGCTAASSPCGTRCTTTACWRCTTPPSPC